MVYDFHKNEHIHLHYQQKLPLQNRPTLSHKWDELLQTYLPIDNNHHEFHRYPKLTKTLVFCLVATQEPTSSLQTFGLTVASF